MSGPAIKWKRTMPTLAYCMLLKADFPVEVMELIASFHYKSLTPQRLMRPKKASRREIYIWMKQNVFNCPIRQEIEVFQRYWHGHHPLKRVWEMACLTKHECYAINAERER